MQATVERIKQSSLVSLFSVGSRTAENYVTRRRGGPPARKRLTHLLGGDALKPDSRDSKGEGYNAGHIVLSAVRYLFSNCRRVSTPIAALERAPWKRIGGGRSYEARERAKGLLPRCFAPRTVVRVSRAGLHVPVASYCEANRRARQGITCPAEIFRR